MQIVPSCILDSVGEDYEMKESKKQSDEDDNIDI